jgi:hypothetical protein
MNFQELKNKILKENTPKEQREYIFKQFTKLHKRSIDKMNKSLKEINIIKTNRSSNKTLEIEIRDVVSCKMAISKDNEYDYYGDGKIFLTFDVPVITTFEYNIDDVNLSTERTIVSKSKGRLVSAQIDGRTITFSIREENKLLDIFTNYKSNKSKIRNFYLSKKKLNLDSILSEPKIKKELDIMLKKQGKSVENKDINHIARKHKVSTRQIAYINDYTYIIFPKEGVNTKKVEIILKNYNFETWAIDSNKQQLEKEEYNKYLLDEIRNYGRNGVLYYRSRNKDFEMNI